MGRLNKKHLISSLVLVAVIIVCVCGVVIYATPGVPECGFEEHEHNDSCYETQFTCIWDKLGDGDPVSPGGNITLVCTTQAHVHGDDCYQINRQQVCTLTEHQHTDACGTVTVTQVCGMAEHVHSDACNQLQTTLICPEDHEHNDACYMTTSVQACGQQAHLHTDSCNGEVVNNTCGQTEHIHDGSCFTENRTLVCTVSEHTHVKSCCAHTHDNSCNGKVLICTKEPHTHTEDCYPDGVEATEIRDVAPKPDTAISVDLSADIETPEMWEQSVPTRLYGNWGERIVKVAKSQLGTSESIVNRSQCTDYIGGYSRYGAWYGSHYGHWCAMFASFCISYAGVKDFPLEASCESWVKILQERGCYQSADSGYIPKPGDLIFFNRERIPGHVGIVTSYRVAPLKELVTDKTSRAERLVDIINGGDGSTFVKKEIKDEDMAVEILTIEGNVRDKGSKTDSVLERRYVITEDDDCSIIGYASVSSAEDNLVSTTLVHRLSEAAEEVYSGRYSDSYNVSVFADPSQFTGEELNVRFKEAKNGEYSWVSLIDRNKKINPIGDVYLLFSGYNGDVRDANMDYVTVITENDELYSYYFDAATTPGVFKLDRK